jgi:RNA polymerase sigma factor (sigma-70 family)
MNWALSILRRRRRSDHRLYDPGQDTAAVSDPDVHAALGELDVKHRTVIVCRHLLGWSVAETAVALKVREGTVKSRLHRAHRILQASLRHLHSPEELS